MPIYEYRCQECEAEFEELVRMSQPDDEVRCPECGQRRSRKKLSAFASRSSSGGSTSRSSCGSGGFS